MENKHASIARKMKIKSYEGGLILPDITKYCKGTVIEFVPVCPWLGNSSGKEERANKYWKYTLKFKVQKKYISHQKRKDGLFEKLCSDNWLATPYQQN